jgi:hydroxymethylglutaryl-CoA lyase
MAKDDLTGNMPTEHLFEYFGFEATGVGEEAFFKAMKASSKVF